MALIKTITCFSTEFADAYHRISKTGDAGIVEILIYTSELSRQSGDQPITRRSLRVLPEDYETYFSEDVLKLEGNSAKSQTYKWLKTLPEYAEAVDV